MKQGGQILFWDQLDRDLIFRTWKYREELFKISLLSTSLSMTTNNVPSSAIAAPQQQVPSTSQNAASPPSKRDLASWWKTFKKNTRREEEKGALIFLLCQYSVLLSSWYRKSVQGLPCFVRGSANPPRHHRSLVPIYVVDF